MTDSYSDSRHQGGQGDNGRDGGRGGRGGRGQGNREGGGFRIRLSDNEMRSARALQEALNLRSTVAVLGFAVRALGQMLEEGKLEELAKRMGVNVHRKEDSVGARIKPNQKCPCGSGLKYKKCCMHGKAAVKTGDKPT